MVYPEDPFAMIYVRKPGENSHGNDIMEHSLPELGYPIEDYRFVFVDDTISSGDTYRETMRIVLEGLPNRNRGRGHLRSIDDDEVITITERRYERRLL
jgi:hypothetical protein